VSFDGLCSAAGNGRDLVEFVDVLIERSEHELLDALRGLIADVGLRSARRDTWLGHVVPGR
jgi:hypothetical protein